MDQLRQGECVVGDIGDALRFIHGHASLASGLSSRSAEAIARLVERCDSAAGGHGSGGGSGGGGGGGSGGSAVRAARYTRKDAHVYSVLARRRDLALLKVAQAARGEDGGDGRVSVGGVRGAGGVFGVGKGDSGVRGGGVELIGGGGGHVPGRRGSVGSAAFVACVEAFKRGVANNPYVESHF